MAELSIEACACHPSGSTPVCIFDTRCGFVAPVGPRQFLSIDDAMNMAWDPLLYTWLINPWE
jgi:hypothetical protein